FQVFPVCYVKVVVGSGQDWPETCANWTIPTDGVDYGCDLWVEVTGLSMFSEQ
ncbi:unnamed protein product, partial [marine sediment metagenome]